MRKKWLIPIGIVLAIIVVAIVAVPFFVDADSFRPTIEEKLSAALGRRVTLGHLSASLLSGGITADNIAISDDPAFSKEPFLQAKSMVVGVEMKPLIFSRELHVESFKVRDPEVALLRSSADKWNFESLASGSSGGSSSSSASSAQNFTVGQVSITGARVRLGRAGSNARQTWQDMDLEAKNISPGSVVPVAFKAKTPGGGAINLQGEAGPLPTGSETLALNRLPFQLKLGAKSVPAEDLETLLQILGYALPSGSRLRGGTLNAALALAGPLDHLVTTGPVAVSNVQLTGFSLASKLAAFGPASGANTGSSTEIQDMKSELFVRPEGIRAEKISVVVPSIGSVTGRGTVSPSNELNFQLVANLAPGSVLGSLTQLLPLGGGDSGGLPFKVTGTTSNPVITPELKISPNNISNLAGRLGNSQTKQNLGSALGGLLGKKKP